MMDRNCVPQPSKISLASARRRQWYALCDPGAEEALYDIHSMRAFAGPEVSVHKVSFNQWKIEADWRWAERLPIRSARAPIRTRL